MMRATNQARRKIHRDLHWTWWGTRKRRSSIKRRLEGRNHHRLNWSWPSLMDWTFHPSRRSVTCLRGPVPRFTSRGRQSGWSEPPPSGDGRRPRPWRSSWEDEGVNITPAGMALCDNDQSAASMPQISRQKEGCGPPECTIARSVGCWTDWSQRGPRKIESRGHERDPEGHPSKTSSSAGPRAHQREPPGRWSISRDGGLRNGGVSVRHLHRIIFCRIIKIESGMAAAPTRNGGKDDSTIRFG